MRLVCCAVSSSDCTLGCGESGVPRAVDCASAALDEPGSCAGGTDWGDSDEFGSSVNRGVSIGAAESCARQRPAASVARKNPLRNKTRISLKPAPRFGDDQSALRRKPACLRSVSTPLDSREKTEDAWRGNETSRQLMGQTGQNTRFGSYLSR